MGATRRFTPKGIRCLNRASNVGTSSSSVCPGQRSGRSPPPPLISYVLIGTSNPGGSRHPGTRYEHRGHWLRRGRRGTLCACQWCRGGQTQGQSLPAQWDPAGQAGGQISCHPIPIFIPSPHCAPAAGVMEEEGAPQTRAEPCEGLATGLEAGVPS